MVENIYNIIEELNQENGSNYKLDVLRKYQGNELLKKVLKMTYDKVCYSFGIRKIPEYDSHTLFSLTLEDGLKVLEELNARTYTGNAAISVLKQTLEGLSAQDAWVVTRIIGRDLKVNVGRSNINKVFKDLIVKPPYMRCGIYGEKTCKNIVFPALLQVKADGMYDAVTVDAGQVTFTTRSGEEKELPLLKDEFINLPPGVYVGELLIKGYRNRQEANGILNSDRIPHEDVYIDLWDLIPLEEYADAKHRTAMYRQPYYERLENLKIAIEGLNRVQLIETFEVNDIQEALQKTSELMSQGFEGGILKDKRCIFKDTTSNQQLKLKLEIDLDMRITGFTEGTKGTKREATFGAITFENDDGTIKGQTSGFTDSQLVDFNSRRHELIGKIMVVQCNDLTKARDKDYYALSHPRFMNLRDDKDTTDSLERALELRDMAMMLK